MNVATVIQNPGQWDAVPTPDSATVSSVPNRRTQTSLPARHVPKSAPHLTAAADSVLSSSATLEHDHRAEYGIASAAPVSLASALDDSAVSQIIKFFQLIDSWDREGTHGNETM